MPFNIGSGRSLGRSKNGEDFVRMQFFREVATGDLVGSVLFERGIEGPPDHVHGGVSAFVLDEAMGSAAWLKGYTCVAARIEVEFLKMTPIQQDLQIRAMVRGFNEPLVEVTAQIEGPSGIVFSRSRGFFHQLSQAKIERFQQRLLKR